MDPHLEIAALLIDLEAILRNTGLWSDQVPTEEALTSTQPFCVDTMDIQQWLQFIFIPRMYELLEAGAPMPEKCDIKPVVEEALGSPSRELLTVIGALDEAITQA